MCANTAYQFSIIVHLYLISLVTQPVHIQMYTTLIKSDPKSCNFKINQHNGSKDFDYFSAIINTFIHILKLIYPYVSTLQLHFIIQWQQNKKFLFV